MADIQVLPLAEQLLTCLCEAFDANPNPPQNCCFRVGTSVAHDVDWYTDLCCEGLAYVALDDIFPSTDQFGDADFIRQAQSACAPASWAVTFRIGIIRCAPTGTDTTMPTCDEWTAAFYQNVHDAQALRRASCCFRAYLNEADPGMSTIIDRQIQTSPEGGCTERYQNVIAQIINCDCVPGV